MKTEENKKLIEEASSGKISLDKILDDDVVAASDNLGAVKSVASEIEEQTLDLVQSAQGRKILTGIISGVDDRMSPEDSENPTFIRPMPVAEISYGHYKIVIPGSEIVNESDVFEDKTHNEKCRYYHREIKRMLGAIVDFKIDNAEYIYKDKLFAVGSVKSAMAIKRIECFKGFGKQAPKLSKGVITEARVRRITRNSGLIVEVGGVESFVGYGNAYWKKEEEGKYRVGDLVAVKVKDIFISGNDIEVACSIKEANPNPYALARMKYKRNQVYAATVTAITTFGIFCAFKGDGYTCLCRYKDVKRPDVGENVQIKVLGFNDRTEHITGEILSGSKIVK